MAVSQGNGVPGLEGIIGGLTPPRTSPGERSEVGTDIQSENNV